MRHFLVPFSAMEWQSPAPGVREKRFSDRGQLMRLVEFSEGFVEKEACTRGHAGWVLEGSFSLDHQGRLQRFREGDALFIPAGPEFAHKAVLGRGERALLLLFELEG